MELNIDRYCSTLSVHKYIYKLTLRTLNSPITESIVDLFINAKHLD